MRIMHVFQETFADGPGIRYSIYVSGCEHHCNGCHNPETWDPNQGTELNEELIEKIRQQIINNKLLDGITISGGDPFHPVNIDGLILLLQSLNDLNKNVWVYTGYTYEELIDKYQEKAYEAFNLIDVLVDGKYVKELHDTSSFRGSTNQRFIKTKHILCLKEQD